MFVKLEPGDRLLVGFVDKHGEMVDGEFAVSFATEKYPHRIVVEETAGFEGTTVGEGSAILYDANLSRDSDDFGGDAEVQWLIQYPSSKKGGQDKFLILVEEEKGRKAGEIVPDFTFDDSNAQHFVSARKALAALKEHDSYRPKGCYPGRIMTYVPKQKAGKKRGKENID